MIELISRSVAETHAFAKKLAENAQAGEIYALSGDLGTGKTVFAKGFAKGLGITQDVTSPTFSIVNEYEGRLPLYHFDVYRIVDVSEMEETGYEDYFYGKGVCLVEWAEMIDELMPPETIRVQITKDLSQGEDFRRITVWGLQNEHFGD